MAYKRVIHRSRRPRSAMGDDYGSFTPCSSIPAGDPYRNASNSCTAPSGEIVMFNADGTVTDPGSGSSSSGSSSSSSGGFWSSLVAGLASSVKPGTAQQPVIVQGGGVSTTTALVIGGGALLLVLLLTRK